MFKLTKVCSFKFHHLELDDLMEETSGNDFYPISSKMNALAFFFAKRPCLMLKLIVQENNISYIV